MYWCMTVWPYARQKGWRVNRRRLRLWRGTNEYNDYGGNFGNGNVGDEITHVALRGVRTMINPFQYGGVVSTWSIKCYRLVKWESEQTTTAVIVCNRDWYYVIFF